MSLEQFSQTIQSTVYKNWFKALDKNIINTAAEKLRSREQTAQKTSFYVTKDTIQDMYKTITGNKLDNVEIQLFMQSLIAADPTKKSSTLTGKMIKVNGSDAVFFESIGFDTITAKLTALLNDYPEVEHAYFEAEQKYYDKAIADLKASPEYATMKASEKQDAIDAVSKKAKERGTFGYYFNKGHVVGVATNLTKQFRSEIEKADQLAEAQRKALLEVLDKYIEKLQKDDLATANLPNAINQELYAGYIKSKDKYLVEIQHRTTNIEAGSASNPIVRELRSLFDMSAKNVADILRSSPALGEALVKTEGSPSYIDILAKELANTIAGRPKDKTVYKQNPRLISKKVNKIDKPVPKTKEIAELKKLRDKVSKVRKDPKQFKEAPALDPQLSLFSLKEFINTHLQDVISANMGDGDSRSVLNYRTGRFASTVAVENLTQSREGMITAFYSYMKNPYATFSEGGAQQYPKSRDPKLLISKSIREIVAEKLANKLRAVSI